MVKRWLIRGTLLSLFFLTTLFWYASLGRRFALRYTYSVSQPNVVQMAELDLGFKHGTLLLAHDGDCGFHPGWRWEIADAPPAESLVTNVKALHGFAGFVTYKPVPYVTMVGIPFWFLTAAAAFALIVGWKRTRPRLEARRSFPVEPGVLTPVPRTSAAPTLP